MIDEWVKLKCKKSWITKNWIKQQRGTVVGRKVNDIRGKKWLQKKEPFTKRKEKTRSIFRALLGLVLHLLRKRFARRGLLRLLLLRGWLLWSFGWGSTPLQDKKGTSRESEAKSTKFQISRRGLYLFLHWGLLWRRNVLRT